MDIPYSDPSPAIDYFINSEKHKTDGGGDDKDNFWGCLGAILCFVAIFLIYYLTLK